MPTLINDLPKVHKPMPEKSCFSNDSLEVIRFELADFQQWITSIAEFSRGFETRNAFHRANV
jgi:hypothetical protein